MNIVGAEIFRTLRVITMADLSVGVCQDDGCLLVVIDTLSLSAAMRIMPSIIRQAHKTVFSNPSQRFPLLGRFLAFSAVEQIDDLASILVNFLMMSARKRDTVLPIWLSLPDVFAVVLDEAVTRRQT